MEIYVHCDVLDQLYKLYVRPNLDYGDVVYQNQNSSLMSKLESTQYAAALAVSGAWRGINTDKLFEELGWESLAYRRWYRRLGLFYKIMNNGTPEYTRRYLPTFKQNPYDLRRQSIFTEERTNTNRDTRTVSIRIVSRLGTTLIQPFGIFLIFLSLKRHCNS